MRKKGLILLFIALAFSAPAALAQYHLSGSDPSGLRWNRMQSEHFDIIFPDGLDSLSREYLYSFEKTRDQTLTGLHIETPRMPIVLHPYNMNSNGMVVWAPRRLELYTTPPGDPLYALNWEMQLATHEGRHIGQMSHYTKGIYKVLGYIAGEQSIALGIGVHPSKALFEGDAVQNETDFTASGRGRNPEFLKFFRASFLEGDSLRYTVLRYGSFRHYTPGKYPFGYMISSTMRDNSGNYYVTGDILAEQVRDWWRIFSVSNRSFIHASGLKRRRNWRLAVARSTELWSREYELRAPYTEFDPLLAKREKVYTEISNPIPLGDETFATMSGVRHERRIVSIDTLGRWHWKRPISSTTSTLVADSDHSFIFSEIVPDPRWEHRSWSVIRRYDAKSNSFETLTRRTRYLNPTPSAGRDSILAAEYKVEGGSDVVVLDREGKLLDRIPAPEKGQVTSLADIGGAIYATVITTEGQGIYRHDGAWIEVVAPQNRLIRELRPYCDSLLSFVSDLDGISCIYALDPSGPEPRLWRIANARYSAEKPHMGDDGSIWYGDYDRRGYQPVKVTPEALQWKEASFSEPYHDLLADRNSRQAEEHTKALTPEEDSLLRQKIDKLESRRYSKLLHGFHIHSWAPFYANVDRLMNDIEGFDLTNFSNWYEYASLGATVLSQNALGTLVTTLGYSYHQRHHGAHAHFSYTGLYPRFDLSVDFNDRSQTHTDISYEPGKGIIQEIDTLARPGLKVNAAVSLPLNFSRGGWNTSFVPQVNYVLTNDSFRFLEPDAGTGDLTPVTQLLIGTLNFSSQLAKPAARLTPRLGFGLRLSGEMRIAPDMFRNAIYGIRAWVYLPGFGKEDGFKLSYWRQYQPWGSFSYHPDYNLVKMPYGFSKEVLMDYHRGTLEYALPIWAGDVDGGFFFYLKRFMIIPFVDLAYDKSHPVMPGGGRASQEFPRYDVTLEPHTFFSYGTALMVTTRLFRIGSDFKIGVRYSRRNIEGDHGRFQFVMSTGL